MFIDNFNGITPLFDRLKKENKKVVLYGTGDGAVKIIDVLKNNGIEISGIFASDDFARYQTFQGHTVKKLADIEDEFTDFTVVIGFASRLDEVIDNIIRISEKHTVLIPDINVSGDPCDIFSRDFLESNIERLENIYDLLDDKSKEFFINLISFKLSGDIKYVKAIESLDIYNRMPYSPHDVTSFVDLGAYRGDTVIEAVKTYPNLKKVIALEPDRKTFEKMEKALENHKIEKNLICACAYDKTEEITIFESGNKNTIIKDNVNFDFNKLQKKKEKVIRAIKCDDIINEKYDLIKLDVEGSEMKAINGLYNTIAKYRPILRISIYHNHRDIFEIPEKILEINKGYKLSLSQKCRYLPLWDVELIAL